MGRFCAYLHDRCADKVRIRCTFTKDRFCVARRELERAFGKQNCTDFWHPVVSGQFATFFSWKENTGGETTPAAAMPFANVGSDAQA